MEADGFGRVSDALRCLDWLLANNVSVSVNAYGINIGNKAWDQWTDAAGAFDPTAPAGGTPAPAATGGVFVQWNKTLAAAGSTHLFVTSAGNGGELLTNQTDASTYYWMPAQLHLSNMIVVGATGEQGWLVGACARSGLHPALATLNPPCSQPPFPPLRPSLPSHPGR